MEILLWLSVKVYSITSQKTTILTACKILSAFVFPLCHRYFHSALQTGNGICPFITTQDRMNCCFSLHGLSYDTCALLHNIGNDKNEPKYLWTVVHTVRFHLSVRDFLHGIRAQDLSICCVRLTVGTEMV
jgi:hypothetical protein